MAYVYILKCSDNSFYVGSTNNLEQRIKKHQSGWGARYTNVHKPVELIYSDEFPTYQEAFKRERQIKGWSRAKKEALIAGDIELLKELSKSRLQQRV